MNRKLIETTRTSLLILLFAGSMQLRAADVIKADNTEALNLGTSWVSGNPPTAADVAVWNNTVTSASDTFLGADTNWAGIRIANPVGPVTIEAGNVLTLGASGIDMSAATVDLTLNNALFLSGAQTWNVGNNLTLTVSGVVTNSGPLTKSGSGLLILGTANSYTGGTLVNAGTIQANNGTSFGNSGGTVTNQNGTTMRINTTTSISNPVEFDGTVTVDLNNLAGNAALRGAWSGSGTVNIINQDGSARRTFTMGGGGNGGGNWANFTGTVNFGTNNGDFRFNDGGSSPNTGNSQATIDLGTGDGLRFFSRNRSATVNIGELRGGPGTQIKQGASSSGTATYNVGGLNTSSTFAGSIVDGGSSSSGFVKLNKVGTGTLTLTGTNNIYAGGTIVSEGTLQMGDGVTTGDLGAGNIAVDATLAINRSDDIVMNNTFSGGGLIRKINSNNLTVTGNNTSSGTFVVEAGTLTVQSLTFSSAISVANGATVDLSASPTVSSILAGDGTISGFVSANTGAILSPGFNSGNGNGATGTLTVSGSLTENGGVLNRFDLSDDPTGTIKTNDSLAVVGDLTLTGANSILVNPVNSALAIGTYRLITFTGVLNGDIANNVVLSGAVGYLTTTNSPNAIDLVVTYSRPATNLTWVGDNTANLWDFATTLNWNDGTGASGFFTGDAVTFNNTGSSTPPVNLIGALPPSSVLVDSTSDYTFTGSGAIFGAGGLTKTNSGTLTVLTVNGYAGKTVVGGGTLAVTNIVNGSQPSGLGSSSSDPANLVLNGGTTLRYDGDSSTSDRGATLESGAAAFDITQPGTTLRLSGDLVGSGGLVKAGPGTLSLTAASSYTGGVVISNGVLSLDSNDANVSGTESGLGATTNTVTFAGGTLQLFGYNGSTDVPGYSGILNPMVVPAGQTGTLRLYSRGKFLAPLSGSGTLNLVVNYVRDDLRADWSAFTGLINVTGKSGTSDEMRVDNNSGYANAAIALNDGVILDRADTANTVNDIGELSGTSLARIAAGNGSGANTTWRVGWKNTSSTFAGTIESDNNIVKVGTGTWTLTGQNLYTGSTTISNGVLAIGDGVTDGSIGSSSKITIGAGAVLDISKLSVPTLNLNFGQILGGGGTLRGGLDTTFGGTVAPGAGNTLTVTNAINLAGTTEMALNRANAVNSARLVSSLGAIQYGGALIITNVGPQLQIGDTFQLFSAAGGLSGGFTSVELPNYYTWNTNNLATEGWIRVESGFSGPAISGFDASTAALGYVTLGATNGLPNGAFTVLSSTNLALPTANWTVETTGNFDANGNLTGLVISTDPATPTKFYLLQIY